MTDCIQWTCSGKCSPKESDLEKRNRVFARTAAREAIVLLKNEQTLPLSVSEPIALLGIGSEKTVKGGTGSGDVNNRTNVSVYEGMVNAGFTITSEDWLEDYKERYQTARDEWKEKVLKEAEQVDNPFDAYADNPFRMPEGRAVSEADIKGAAAAVYVVSRISGEGKDRRLEAGDYYLSQREEEDICFLNEKQIPVVLLINAGGPVELTGILEKTEYIKAILNISQLGQEGGHAVADILAGNAVPCGKLTTTWARHYTDYPYAENFSYLNGNLKTEEYCEGIYVGYRYFDSFHVQPLFPFGYGLSYTEFTLTFCGARAEENELIVEVKVKNIGNNYTGKEVVQIYASLPQNEMEKEYHRLVGFGKTQALKPRQEEKLTIAIDAKSLAVFREDLHAWQAEAGTYGLWIGNSSAQLSLAATVKVEETVTLEETCLLEAGTSLSETLKLPEVWKAEQEMWRKEAERGEIFALTFSPKREKKTDYRMMEKVENLIPMQLFSTEQLIPLLHGNTGGRSSNLGAAGIHVPGSAGETIEGITGWGEIPVVIMADGPAGLRLQQNYEVDRDSGKVCERGVFGSLENGFLAENDTHENADRYYQYCTAFPVGTALAQTWNMELLEEFGKHVAEEMEEFQVGLWLAPGLNIHRNPLCGRNFEYYSEDPLLSGLAAAAVTAGVQSRPGCGVTIKHFACNNQEDNRMGVDAHMSEKTLREIYCRGFELAVKRSNPEAMMSSYNLLNGVHAANSKDLCTRIAREEWGFHGMIMSDWNTTVPEDGSVPWKCIAAGNDMIMPGNEQDETNIRKAYKEGLLSEREIRACAERVLRMIAKLSAQNK